MSLFSYFTGFTFVNGRFLSKAIPPLHISVIFAEIIQPRRGWDVRPYFNAYRHSTGALYFIYIEVGGDRVNAEAEYLACFRGFYYYTSLLNIASLNFAWRCRDTVFTLSGHSLSLMPRLTGLRRVRYLKIGRFAGHDFLFRQDGHLFSQRKMTTEWEATLSDAAPKTTMSPETKKLHNYFASHYDHITSHAVLSLPILIKALF